MSTTLLAAPPDQQRFIFYDVPWDYYTQTLDQLEAEGRHARVTYDEGMMEIMTVGNKHELAKKTIARLLELYSLEKDIPITGLGQVTLRRKILQKGLEPDECYYVHTPPPPSDAEGELDLNRFSPPDLAIEVDISNSSIPREPIYAALKVSEIWRFDGEKVMALHRQEDGHYQPSDRSLAFADLPMDVFNPFLAMALRSQHDGSLAFRDWIRGQK